MTLSTLILKVETYKKLNSFLSSYKISAHLVEKSLSYGLSALQAVGTAALQAVSTAETLYLIGQLLLLFFFFKRLQYHRNRSVLVLA